MKQAIQIDGEFRDLLPTPSPESLQELEKGLLAEGCREPLVAWRHDGKLILLDACAGKIGFSSLILEGQRNRNTNCDVAGLSINQILQVLTITTDECRVWTPLCSHEWRSGNGQTQGSLNVSNLLQEKCAGVGCRVAAN